MTRAAGRQTTLIARLTTTLILGLIGIHCGGASAQADYPVRPLRMVVPFPPGGSNDILGRFIAHKLSLRLGQPVVIDNRAGADGIIGTEMVARAAPDGYTILIMSTSLTMNAVIHKLSFDPVRSLTPISLIASGANVIMAGPAFTGRTVPDLIALAKARPGQIRYATSGVGGFNHFGGELFNSLAGVAMTHVPYKGGGPSMIDIMGGVVEIGFGTLVQSIPHIRSGKLRAIAVGSLKRSPLLPEVPTIAEAGVPGYDGSIWWGILGPAELPAPIVARLNGEISALLKDPEMVRRLETEAAEAIVAGPEALARLIAQDLDKWRRVAKQTGIRGD